jgi:hypothetical protein
LAFEFPNEKNQQTNKNRNNAKDTNVKNFKSKSLVPFIPGHCEKMIEK